MSTTRKPDPNAGALFLAKLLAEDEADRIESISDEEFLAEQKRAVRASVERATNGQRVAQPTDAVAPVERLPPLSRGQRVALLLAAAFVVAIVVAVVKGPEIVASFHDDSGHREPGPAPPSP